MTVIKMNNVRTGYEKRERETLHPKAVLSEKSMGRKRPEDSCPIRTVFQRDRDRIIHSKAFRRLKHKTQVFIAPMGDHYRTRLTHTLEVAQIARTISRALKLNEDLTEAIALGHDLGHTPFGHTGEEVLNDFLDEGFHHAAQSLRVVEILAKNSKGLNLCKEVKDGIALHSKGMKPLTEVSMHEGLPTLEAQVMRLSDIIGYINHDLDDALRAGLVNISDLPAGCTKVLGDSHSARIDRIVKDVIENSFSCELERIAISNDILKSMGELRDFLNDKVYMHKKIAREAEKAYRVISELCEYFLRNPEELVRFSPNTNENNLKRRITDLIAGMTDRYAIQLFTDLYIPLPADA